MKIKTWLAVWPDGYVVADWQSNLNKEEVARLMVEADGFWPGNGQDARLVQIEFDVPDDIWETEPNPYDLCGD